MISKDATDAIETLVDLINTDPTVAGQDLLDTIEALHDFVARNAIAEVQPVVVSDLVPIHALRTLGTALAHEADEDTRIKLINRMVLEAKVAPRLTNHDGYAWHIHYAGLDPAVADYLGAGCGVSLMLLVDAGELARFSTCQNVDCRNAFLDLSKNRSRKYCDSASCGGRVHSANYRARARDGVTRDGATRDGVLRDGVARDGAARDGVVRDGVGRDGAARDGVPVDGVTRDGAGRDGVQQPLEAPEPRVANS